MLRLALCREDLCFAGTESRGERVLGEVDVPPHRGVLDGAEFARFDAVPVDADGERFVMVIGSRSTASPTSSVMVSWFMVSVLSEVLGAVISCVALTRTADVGGLTHRSLHSLRSLRGPGTVNAVNEVNGV